MIDDKKMEGLLIDSIMLREDMVRSCETFEEGGVLTTDKGFTIRMTNGSEFQVTVVQSKQGKNMTCTVCSNEEGEEYEDEYTDGKQIMCDWCIDNHCSAREEGNLSK